MPKFIGIFAISVFTGMAFLMVFTFGGFNYSIGGLLGALATLTTFYISLEALARLRDGPMYDFYEYLVNGLQQLGVLFALIIFWSILAVMVGLSLLIQAQYFPGNFISEEQLVLIRNGGEALRLGYSLTMIFGIFYYLDMPVRPTKMLKHFGLIK
tara:strand:+ start:88 stop:552 length:465 start_codon:yes stop_codon:yes gene_type:complete